MPAAEKRPKRPTKVAVLTLDGCTPLAPIGALELLRKCGEIHQQRTGARRPPFEPELVAARKRNVRTADGLSIRCHRVIDELRKTDLLVLPAIEMDIERKLEECAHLIEPIRRLHRRGARVASLCTGAFLLAETGLLDGRDASTHWAAAAVFRQRYPKVRLREERILVDNGDTLTSGGATSFMSLMLYLVEQACGKATAIAASKMLLIDYQKPAQSSYAMFAPRTEHGDGAIDRVQTLVQGAPGKPHSVSELAAHAGLSLRSFIRRFKAATGETPQRYVQRVRIERARALLESTALNVDEIAQRVGYSDAPSFRRLFTRHTGLAPSAYRSRYRRVA